MAHQYILTETAGPVGIVTLNRPDCLNALSDQLIDELVAALAEFDRRDDIRAVVIRGNEKVFAAGADIKTMAEYSYMDVYEGEYISRNWDALRGIRKPLIAAVAGYALGGGCELAMTCDIVIAAENAQFGQSEIKLGIIPGAGGTQRLPRAVGKAKAMDLCLTGRMMSAVEAERAGLVSRVVPVSRLLEEALEAANSIAARSMPIAMMVKEAVNAAYESSLTEGLRFERRLFHSTFATEDQKEGMKAFLEKRNAQFTDR